MSVFVSKNGHGVHFRTQRFFAKALMFKEITNWHTFCLLKDVSSATNLKTN